MKTVDIILAAFGILAEVYLYVDIFRSRKRVTKTSDSIN